ncbi:glycosyltransferase family 2 protein [Chloroflexota bacterium]
MENKASQSTNVNGNKGIPDNPWVSIITPVLNGVKYLEECIQSILNQNYPYIEHVIIDGGSSDGTVDVLSKYEDKYPERISFISEPDKSAEEAWNKGLAIAKGEVFGWLGADDIYEPDAIQTVIEFFRSNPDAYFVFGDLNLIDESGQIFRRIHCTDFDLDEIINNKCEIGATSVFFRRAVVEHVGLLNTKTRISELDYWIRVAKVFQIRRIDKVLSSLRIHEGGFSGSIEASKAVIHDGFFISLRHGGSIFSRRAKSYCTMKLAPIIEGLRPLIGFAYPFIKRLLRM